MVPAQGPFNNIEPTPCIDMTADRWITCRSVFSTDDWPAQTKLGFYMKETATADHQDG